MSKESEFSPDMQWKIINETGILKKHKDVTMSNDTLLMDSILYTIPFTFLYFSLDYIIHVQYDLESHFNLNHICQRAFIIPCLCFLIFYTMKFQENAICQVLYSIVAWTCGCYLIYLTEEDQTFGSMLVTPGLAIIWIYLIIQTRLSLALTSLMGATLFYYRESILKVFDSHNRMFKLK